MSAKRDNATVVGVGVTACAACCAGPILGALAAIGLGTAVGIALFGVAAIVLGASALTFVAMRRRHRSMVCAPPTPAAVVRVELTGTRPRA